MGDFSAHFHRPESGVHTVEGTVAGGRAATLSKKRAKEQEAFEMKKRQIVEEMERKKKSSISDKFAGMSEASERKNRNFRAKTVGLVTAEEFKRAQQKQRREENGEDVGGDDDGDADANKKSSKMSREELAKSRKAERKDRKKKLKEKKKMLSTLSFANDEEEAELIMSQEKAGKSTSGGGGSKLSPASAAATTGDDATNLGLSTARSSLKDPSVDTSFLPDRQREEALQLERKRLEQKWKEEQLVIKSQSLEIVYSYWDGSGHRRSVDVRKGDTIGDFLELVRRDLCKEFREMQSVAADALMYVKEDLILPADITFYDLIATKARGKSGPLFHFDVHDDIRIGAIDSRIEKDESHPGKVVERRWYDRNKHIFPASRWEVFDPLKDYGRYTIHGGEVNKKGKN